ncbi:MAG: hypothetical protein PHE56_16675 [Bacteroidales bacterium]|nr:hypothetical protein [Bacteroidales bacterium]
MTNVLKKTPEYKVIFQNNARIVEDVPKNSLQELCQYVLMRSAQLGDPQKVIFPNGQELIWGEVGAYAAHQFAAKGRITESDFLQMLTEHSSNNLTLAKAETDKLRDVYLSWKKEYKQAEQKVQEALAGLSASFEEYMTARKAMQTINEGEVNHDSQH